MNRIKSLVLLGAFLVACTPILADQRLFTYSYQADSILPKNATEFENHLTMQDGNNSGQTVWKMRQELEFGLTDAISTAVYFNTKLTNGAGESTFKFDTVSSEWKYMVQSPNTNAIGVLIYGEVSLGEKEIELEEKLVLQHNMKDWTFVGNVNLAQNFNSESGSNIQTSELGLSGAIGYKIHPNWTLGIEGNAIRTLEDFYKSSTGTGIFLGPVVHYESKNFSTTITALSQITKNSSDFDKFELRMINSFTF